VPEVRRRPLPRRLKPPRELLPVAARPAKSDESGLTQLRLLGVAPSGLISAGQGQPRGDEQDRHPHIEDERREHQ
jgi:hypothetical protein